MRPIFKRETIEKICRSYRFYMLVRNEELDFIKGRIEYFDQFFEDVIGDVIAREENFDLMGEVEEEIGQKFLNDKANLFELEVLSGMQIIFRDFFDIEEPEDLEGDLDQLILASIMVIEGDIKKQLLFKKHKDLVAYGQVLINELMDLEQVLMDDVAGYLRKQGFVGSIINFGAKGLKIKDV